MATVRNKIQLKFFMSLVTPAASMVKIALSITDAAIIYSVGRVW